MGVEVEKENMDDTELANKYKDEGNTQFKAGDWDGAIQSYTKAINCTSKESLDKCIYYKNRAAAYLKLNKNEEAVKDTTSALDISPNDPKSLFRRCQALENLSRFEEAYRDARQVLTNDPTNKIIQPVLARLHEICQERLRENALTVNKVKKMCDIAFDLSAEKDKRETALNNLLVLARESAAADLMMNEQIITKISKLMKVEKNEEIYLTTVRIVGELSKNNVTRCKQILQQLGVPWFLEIINSNVANHVNAVQYCLQTVINTLSGLSNKPESRPDAKLCEENYSEIDTILTCLMFSTTSRTITGLARDAIIELLTRNVHYTALNWAERLVDIKGVERLMEVASELQEYKYESAMEITSSTRNIVAVCLSRIYDNMYYDQAREKYISSVDSFLKDKLLSPEIENKVRAVVAMTTLLFGPIDVGNTMVAKDGIMEMVLVMANTDDPLQQKVACECIIHASSKKDKVSAIVKMGVTMLKKLYNSTDESVRVRALVGLCKLGASGGTDASIRPFADGSTSKLAEACRRFLINPAKDREMRRWAAEGLSYLTLDADVKEKLIEDTSAIQALIELAKSGDQSVVYGVVTTLVNLANAYEKQEVIPEMVELAKFAKHHIPEEHELDDPDFVAKRLMVLGNEGITSALVSLSKTESQNSKELICRVFNALCSNQELRGIVVQQGGAKVLLPMALDGTDKGKKQASQALARIGITINPEVAFPGQRCLEVIRPLLNLLHPECTALENFESLMALCNLAAVSDSVRLRILKENGLCKIESYMFEDHVLLRRAATQCITNLITMEEVIKVYEGENDKTKFMFLLCFEEDDETVEAAAGSLAMLTSVSSKCCAKVFQAKDWVEIFEHLLANPKVSVQHRGLVLVNNIIKADMSLAEKLIQTNVMEVLMALSKLNEQGREKISELATEALTTAEKYQLIKKPGEGDLVQQPETIPEVDLDDPEMPELE